jgi:membrane associated rhomboid family serine protease
LGVVDFGSLVHLFHPAAENGVERVEQSRQLIREIYGKFSTEVAAMYLRIAFWTGAMAYISFLFSRFAIGTGPSSPGVMLTAALFGAMTGLALGCMFAKRDKRKALLR